jgi:hypothetical protein
MYSLFNYRVNGSDYTASNDIVTYRPVARQQACKHIPATHYSTQQEGVYC